MTKRPHSNNNNRGSPRGVPRGRPGRGGGRGRGRGRGQNVDDFSDFTIYDFMDGSMDGFNSPRGRGRGGRGRARGSSTPRGGFRPPRGFDNPRGRGRAGYSQYVPGDLEEAGVGRGQGSPGRSRGRGRGAKNFRSKLSAGVPLSKVLYEDRPLLRPITFVRSVFTATLFQEEEEILQPLAEEVANDEKSHVPTADRVTRVFNGDDEDYADAEVSGGEEPLEEIDFSEIGRVQAAVDAAAANLPEASALAQQKITVVEEKFTGFYIDPNPAPSPKATRPSHAAETALGDLEDEVIVYVAPLPRAGPITPPTLELAQQTLPYTSILTGKQGPTEEVTTPEPCMEETADTAMANDHIPAARESVPEDVIEAETPKDFAAETYTPKTVETSDEPIKLAEVTTKTVIEATEEVAIEAQTSAVAEEEPPSMTAAPAFKDVSFSFASKQTQEKKFTRKVHPVRTPKALLRRAQPRRKPLRGFGTFGAQLEEAHLHEGEREDPRKSERRRGDSDLDWGEGSEVEDAIEELSTGIGEMEIDPDLDASAMASFVKSMSVEGSHQVTMDDLADIERLRAEDDEEEDETNGSESEDEEDSELEAVVRMEEDVFVAEANVVAGDGKAEDTVNSDDEQEEDVSSDDEETPRRGFQARLEKIRRNAKGKQKSIPPEDLSSDDDDDDVELSLDMPWADRDEEYIEAIEAIIDKDEHLLSRKDRKKQTKLFNAIQNGDFDLDDYEQHFTTPSKRKKKFKNTGLPEELREQWEQDRAKKAENKRKRQLARLEAAADPLTKKKGGKKGLKAMLAAARVDEDGPIELPNRIVNLTTLEQQIRRFIQDLGKTSMSLPPCDKTTRKRIHELASAFNLNSLSKGHGEKRYTTLTKTSKTGLAIKERKIGRILREDNGDWTGPGKGKTKVTSLAKHREGEEVGKAAPKIEESNVGFKLLAAMGWAEGERIGLSGGLDAPLVAKMKKTKLGLGASFS